MTSFQKPTSKFVDEVLGTLTSIQLRRRFYAELKNPFFVEPLLQRGYFDKAPDPLKQGNTIRFLDWPELEYLEKVAAEVPETAYSALSRTQKTENYFVQRSFIGAAVNLPVEWAAKFTREILPKWFSESDSISSFAADGLVALCIKLAQARNEAALFLADRILFSYRKDEKSSFLKVKPNYWEEWDFQDMFGKIHQPMLKAFQFKYLEILCFNLRGALSLEGAAAVERSIYWQHAIGEHEQDKYSDEVKNLFVKYIREASLALVSVDAARVFDILALPKFSASIFRRIELHISSVSKEKVDYFLNRLLVPEFFWELDFHHENFHFLKENFKDFPPEKKELVLKMISKGPPDKEDKRYAQGRIYAAIADQLYGAYKAEYEALPKPEHPDFLIWTEGGWVGPTSPISTSELENYSANDIVKYLKEWVPKKGWREETPSGLGRLIEEDVKKSPAKYLNELHLFQIEKPTYVNHILGGIKSTDDSHFTKPIWDSILSLCEWVVSLPIKLSVAVDQDTFNEDPDWQWTRRKIASLLFSKMRKIPLEYRARVWNLISLISKDNDPTKEEDARSVETQSSGYELSINSTKGEALHAAVEYGLWLREVDKSISIPELFTFMDDIVKRDFDGLRSQIAVFGRFFPWLHLLNSSWATSNVDKIFPENDWTMFSASWVAYISHCEAYTDIFPVLERKYFFVLSNQEKIKEDKYYYSSRLASHIATFYLRDKIKNDADLIKAVFSSLTEKHVFSFLGRCLDGDGGLPKDRVQKCAELWDYYIEDRVRGKNLTEQQKEALGNFSFWVENTDLDTAWKLNQLEMLVKLEIKLKDTLGICAGLTHGMTDHPKQVLSILKGIIEKNLVREFMLLHGDRIEEIVKIGHNHSDLEVRKLTDKVINIVGERGYRGYEKYLPR